MRRNIVAGNWKSNELFSQADELLNDIAEGLREFDNIFSNENWSTLSTNLT